MGVRGLDETTSLKPQTLSCIPLWSTPPSVFGTVRLSIDNLRPALWTSSPVDLCARELVGLSLRT